MKRSFEPGLIAVAATLVLAAAIPAQQSPRSHSLIDGAWALQFGIGDNFTLRGFEGATISAKHHGSQARALRYGLSVSGGYWSDDEEHDRTDVAVGLDVHFLRYPTLARDPRGSIQMYWGFGPHLGFNVHRESGAGGESVTAREGSIGAGGTIGAEWFVRPRISLSAEYQTWLTATFRSRSDPAPDDWSVQLTQRPVLFGVSVYFQ